MSANIQRLRLLSAVGLDVDCMYGRMYVPLDRWMDGWVV